MPSEIDPKKAQEIEAESRKRISRAGAGRAGNEFTRRRDRLEGPDKSGTFEDDPNKRDINGPKAV